MALHGALHQLRPVTGEHTQMPYAEAFNWDELLLPLDMEHEWYAVASSSTCKNGSVGGRKFASCSNVKLLTQHISTLALYELDEKAHAEALRSGGVINPCLQEIITSTNLHF